MADLYTGKYLDGAGLNILWSKIKRDFAPAKNYAVRGEANTFTEKNEFTHVDGIKAKKFVVDGGTASQLLLADGTTKLVSYFATADHNHDAVYAKLGSANTFKETNTFQKAVTIGTTSVATVLLDVKGAGTFSDYVTAKGFKVGTQTGFLKANGTVDTNTYALSTHNHDGIYQPAGEYATIGGSNTFSGVNKFTNAAGVTAKKFVVDGGAGTNLLVDNGNLKPITDFATAGHNHDGVYQPVGDYATISGANNFTHVDGVKAKKFVVDGGTASQLLLANGATKAVSDFATAGHNHDDRYALKNHNHNGVYQPVGDYATVSYVDSKVTSVLKFKGSVSSTSALPTSGVELGWTYVVSEAGEYASEVCEVGDMIVCTAASPLAWVVIQRNIPGVLTETDINDILK